MKLFNLKILKHEEYKQLLEDLSYSQDREQDLKEELDEYKKNEHTITLAKIRYGIIQLLNKGYQMDDLVIGISRECYSSCRNKELFNYNNIKCVVRIDEEIGYGWCIKIKK